MDSKGQLNPEERISLQASDSKPEKKFDVITALQDEIDAYSLSLFEALRGLRDVSTGQASTSNQQSITHINNSPAKVNTSLIDQEDSDLVKTLANAALLKSDVINNLLDDIPGLHRTRSEQMEKLDTLVKENLEVDSALKEYLVKAKTQQGLVQEKLRHETCYILGIDIETSS